MGFLYLGWRLQGNVQKNGCVGPYLSAMCGAGGNSSTPAATRRLRRPCWKGGVGHALSRNGAGALNPDLLYTIWDVLFQEDFPNKKENDFGGYDFNQLLISGPRIRLRPRSWYEFVAFRLQAEETFRFLPGEVSNLSMRKFLHRWRRRRSRRWAASTSRETVLPPRRGRVPGGWSRSATTFISHRVDLTGLWPSWNKGVCIWFEHLWHLIFAERGRNVFDGKILARYHDPTIPIAFRLQLDNIQMHKHILTGEESCELLGRGCPVGVPKLY